MNPAAIQDAVYDLLVGDATLLASPSSGWDFDPVFADVPQGEEAEDSTYYPFISFGPDNTTPFDAKTFTGGRASLQINVWSRAADYTECKQVAERVYTLLHKQPLTISGANHVITYLDSVNFTLDPDGETRRGLILMTVVYENT